MIDPELLEQFQMLAQGMADMETRITERLETKIKEAETRTRIFVENTVTKRIDSLFDGYKLNHEKQWELERKTELLEQQMDDLLVRIASLESKIA